MKTILLEELARAQTELLSKQPPVTLEQAKAQAKWIEDNISSNKRKRIERER